MVKFPAAWFIGYKDCCGANDAQKGQRAEPSVENTQDTLTRKSLFVLPKQKVPFNISLFTNLICINSVLFHASHIHAAEARVQAHSCMHVLQREAHVPRGLDRPVGFPPDCTNNIRALNQLWTCINPAEERVPDEINRGNNHLC